MDTVIGRIPDPSEEFGPYMRYHAGVNKLYCSFNDGSLAVIDAAADTFLGSTWLGCGAEQLIADTLRNRLFVAGHPGGRDTPVVIDAETDSVIARLPSVAGAELLYSPVQNCLYCFKDTARVIVIECSTYSVAGGIPAPSGHRGFWEPSSDRVYYATWDSVIGIECATNRVLPAIPVSGWVYSWVSDTVRYRIYCATDDTLYVVDIWQNSVIARLPGAYALAWDRAGSRAFAVTGHSEVTVVHDDGVPCDERVRAVPDGVGSMATVVRHTLYQPPRQRAKLLDSSGRKVADLLPGANDLRRLPLGVYFVRPASNGGKVLLIP